MRLLSSICAICIGACGSNLSHEAVPEEQGAPQAVPAMPMQPSSAVASSTAAPAPPISEPACTPPAQATPVCGGNCSPIVEWTQEYKKPLSFAPHLLHSVSDAEGNIIVVGTTGRGPTALGGRSLYDLWPRGLGEAFAAKYDRQGRHLWSRALFEASPVGRKRGARSGVRAVALGTNAAIHVLASRIGGAEEGAYLVALSPDGRTAQIRRVQEGLPTLAELQDRDGLPAAIGARDVDASTTEVLEYRFEDSGSLIGQRRAAFTRPSGTVGAQRVQWSPRGVLWTAGLLPHRTAEGGGNLICPIYETRRERPSGRLVRNGPPQDKACSWRATELLVAGITSSTTADWLGRFAVPGYDPGAHTALIDAGGNSYLVGAFTGTARFGPHVVCAFGLPSGYAEDYFGSVTMDAACECMRDYADVFVAKLDPTGNPAWVRQLGGFMEDRTGTVAIDARNNVIVTLGSTPQPDFTVPRLGPGPPLWSIVAYNPNGVHLWTHRLAERTPPLVIARSDGSVVFVESVAPRNARDGAGIRLTAIRERSAQP